MKKYLYLSFILLISLSATTCSDKENNSDERVSNNGNLIKAKGNSIQIDPGMLYSLGITPEQLIIDLKKADIKTVHYFIVSAWDGSKDDNLFRNEYIKALQENDIGIWLMVLANCFYGNTSLPEKWKMELLTPYPGDIHFYSFHNDDFVNWQVERVKRIIKNHDFFMGIEFAESYFPEWKTIETNSFYGDVSPTAREKFTKEFLKIDRATLTFDEIRKNNELYKKWQDFRVEAILNFNHKIKEAVKSSDPEMLFASWGMGIRNGTLGEIREHFGLDMERLVKEVEPDIFFIQTASQDWLDPDLKSNYLDQYEYARKAIQEANPKVKMAVQADIASLSYQNPGVGVRLPDWWPEFMAHSAKLGYYTNTSYEYAFCKKQNLWVK